MVGFAIFKKCRDSKVQVNGMAVRLGSLGDGKEPDSLIKFT